MEKSVIARHGSKLLPAAIALCVGLVVIPASSNAQGVQTVRVKGKVGVKGAVNSRMSDSTGDAVVSRVIPDMGLTDSAGSDGALDVNTFPGGGGILAVGDCSAVAGPSAPPGQNLPNVMTIDGGQIVTAFLITGANTRTIVSSAATDALIGAPDYPITIFRTTAESPNLTSSLGTGLSLTAPLKLTCTAADGSDTAGNVVVLGR